MIQNILFHKIKLSCFPVHKQQWGGGGGKSGEGKELKTPHTYHHCGLGS